MAWSVYIILASDGSLYTGITTDICRRYRQHATGAGAKYFHRGRRPLRVLYRETGHTKSSASRREAAIKQLPRLQKWRLIEAHVT
ncbi:MAG TPA: GIY-YIG nuclease family protein [Porticoccaceae bacterium]|nr:GIY-YIG nuclease family protein [Porticoccaceae bacterium]